MDDFTVTVDKAGKLWQVRIWTGGVGSFLWDFKDELDARRLAMRLRDALVTTPSKL